MLERVAALREQKVIRQISAIFDTRRLGYRGMLVAARTPAERQDDAAAVFSTHPGVSHNYLREHELNLWFTLAVPPHSQLGLDRTVELLGELAEVDVIRPMPALRFFKIGVDLDVKGDRDPAAKPVKAQPAEQGAAARGADRPRHRRDPRAAARPAGRARAVRRARGAGVGFETRELLAHGHAFLATGQMRRYAAVLAHRNAGFVQNGMGVWRVPEERLDECGSAWPPSAASRTATSGRPIPDWPYNLFSMTHGRTKAECEAVLRAISDETGPRTTTPCCTPPRSTRRRASPTSRPRKRRGSRRTPRSPSEDV